MDSYKEYMYYLLISPLKKVKKAANQFYILFKVLGGYADNAMNMLFKARQQSMIAKADDCFLSEHGKDRKMHKYEGETYENYRKRLMLKAEIAMQAGSNYSIILTLISLGIEKPIVIPTYKRDSERWAEFDIKIDELYMDIIDLYIIMKEIRKIKQASSKPNYGYILHSDNGVLCETDIRLRIRMGVNELGDRYLDGTWYLDGEYLLGESPKTLRECKMTIRTLINNIVTATVHMTIKNHYWTLDGSYNLVGEKLLNSECYKEDLE